MQQRTLQGEVLFFALLFRFFIISLPPIITTVKVIRFLLFLFTVFMLLIAFYGRSSYNKAVLKIRRFKEGAGGFS